mgnify:CR=1 FL=1
MSKLKPTIEEIINAYNERGSTHCFTPSPHRFTPNGSSKLLTYLEGYGDNGSYGNLLAFKVDRILDFTEYENWETFIVDYPDIDNFEHLEDITTVIHFDVARFLVKHTNLNDYIVWSKGKHSKGKHKASAYRKGE